MKLFYLMIFLCIFAENSFAAPPISPFHDPENIEKWTCTNIYGDSAFDSISELYNRAGIIFIGKALSIENLKKPNEYEQYKNYKTPPPLPTRTTFSVSNYLKTGHGFTNPKVEIYSQPFDRQSGDCAYKFEPGKEYLVIAFYDYDSHWQETDIARTSANLPTKPLDKASSDIAAFENILQINNEIAALQKEGKLPNKNEFPSFIGRYLGNNTFAVYRSWYSPIFTKQIKLKDDIHCLANIKENDDYAIKDLRPVNPPGGSIELDVKDCSDIVRIENVDDVLKKFGPSAILLQ